MVTALQPKLFTFNPSIDELRKGSEELLSGATRRLAVLEAHPGPRTVENTLVPLNDLLVEVYNVGRYSSILFLTHPNAESRTAAREVSESVDHFVNDYRLHEKVYDALGELEQLSLDDSTRFAVEKMRREMRRAGVTLPRDDREKARKLNDEIDRLSNDFQANIHTKPRAVEVSNASEFHGLPEEFIRRHAPDADGVIRLWTNSPDISTVLCFADSGDLRRRVAIAHTNRAYPENLPVLHQILERRHELANLLGYPEYASYIVEDKMMGTPAKARFFFERLQRLLRPLAERELQRFLERKRRDDGPATVLYPWDCAGWQLNGYYDTKIRGEEFDVDQKKLKEYFLYPAVRDGLFNLCHRLFGLDFQRIPDADVWHESVEAFDIALRGKPLGRFYLDLVPRDGKYSHAAQFDLRAGGEGGLAQAALVCNFLEAGVPVEQCTMKHGDVETFFHEFGHLLHGFLSSQNRWLYNRQYFIEWDFVEVPSMLFEEWASDPATLGTFARHYQTGEPIPTDLVRRVQRASAVGRAALWLAQLGAAAASLAYYDHDPEGMDTTQLLKDVIAQYFPIPLPPEAHFEAGWVHLTHYSAMYYTYAWSLVIARDVLRPFLEKGDLTDPTLATRYAERILGPGSSKPASQLILDYLGQDFSYDSFEGWVAEWAKTLSEPAKV